MGYVAWGMGYIDTDFDGKSPQGNTPIFKIKSCTIDPIAIVAS